MLSTGAIAQLGERLLCKQEVVGSIPSGSTTHLFRGVGQPVCLSCPSLRPWRCGRMSWLHRIAETEIRRVRNNENSWLPTLSADHVLSDIVKRRFVRMPPASRWDERGHVDPDSRDLTAS